MARPRKSPDGMDARQRICDALWTLLEDHELRDITIGMVTTAAGCNRGTFYYHFKDMNDLLDAIIADDVMRPSVIAEFIFRISAGDEDSVMRILSGEHMRKLSIVVNHAGIEIAFKKVFEMLVSIWNSILCPEGGEIKPEAQAIVLYYTGGMLTMVSAVEPEKLASLACNHHLASFVISNATFLVGEICRAQGLPKDVAQERITTVVQFLDTVR